MSNTTFFKRAEKNSSSITWGDIFSESFKRHSKTDMERKLSAGTISGKVSRADMLDKWQKPWLWFSALKLFVFIGVALFVADYLIMYISGGYYFKSIDTMLSIFLPMIIPILIMIFLWELNIPSNMSIYELAAYFLLGGLISFVAAQLIIKIIAYIPNDGYAAFCEEPAKLIAAVVLMYYFSRQKRLYGITGLVIGAAVGAGFAAMENVDYGFKYGIETIFMRSFFSLGGHTLWAAGYSAAIALNCKDKKLSIDGFLTVDFVIAAAIAVVTHYLWNTTMLSFIRVIIIGVQWMFILFVVRKCIKQVVDVSNGRRAQLGKGNYAAAAADAGSIRISCISGALSGSEWSPANSSVLSIGRNGDNFFRFPADTKGVSRSHCTVYKTSRGWVLRDNNSSYGTYLNGNRRLTPGTEELLKPNDVFYVGEKTNAFKVY